jgi:hypothetical protein
MAGKAQFKLMLAARAGKSDPGDSTDTKDFGKTAKKKKGGGLQDAARRRLQKMNAGKKNGNN